MYDHTIYTIERDYERYWVARLLTPKSSKVSEMHGYYTSAETVEAVKEDYGEHAERVPASKFQQERERRTVHTPEMLTLLRENWTDNDLSSGYVYGSILRPVGDLRIAGATGIIAPSGTKYEQWTVHGYIVSAEPLDKDIVDHYDLVFISRA